MIAPEVADSIKHILGKGYAEKIVEYLIQENIKRPSGEVYSRQDIYNLFSLEDRNNEIVEDAILDLVETTKENQKKNQRKKNQRMKALLK